MNITACQLNFKIGDFQSNLKKIFTKLDKHQHDDIIVFSELALSGYYPMDLIEEPLFFEKQQIALQELLEKSKSIKAAIVIGLITENSGKGKRFHNSLHLIHQGKILFTYHKQLLPVYNIFDEARHFTPGTESGIFEYNNKKLGFLICEDAWAHADNELYEHQPVDILKQNACDLVICINSSPSSVNKQVERFSQFAKIAKYCHAPIISVNQVGGNDEIIFDGASFALNEEGRLIGVLPSFTEASGTLMLDTLTPSGHFQDFEMMEPNEFYYHHIIFGLKDYVKKCGFHSVVVSISGGIDSALTLALTVAALGHKKVHALALPSRYSSAHSVEDAKRICQNLDVPLTVYSIDDEFGLALKQFEAHFNQAPNQITEQNMQARIRGRILMEYSNQTGALVLSCGNKSELSVGYTTLYGDMAGGLNIIGDLYKTEVYLTARYYNEQHPKSPIPQTILDKAPSAELSPNQLDTDNLPPYEVLDPILKLYIEGNVLDTESLAACQTQIENIDLAMISKIQDMVDKAEFKRRQSPPIIRVQKRAFGIGRQLPIAALYPKHVRAV